MSAAPTMPAPSDAALFAAHGRVRAQLYALARENLALFCELVLRDERTGARITLGAHHQRFIELVQRNPRICWESFVGSGKSAMAVALILWMLGKNPNLRAVISSNTQTQAAKLGRAARLYIERSDELHRVFPGLRHGSSVWRDDAFTVDRSGILKDPSLQCVGARGAVLGSRSDLLLLDDIESVLDATSEPTRTATYQWVTGNLLTRTTPGAKLVALGTPWHRGDTLRTLAQSAGWVSLKTPAIDPATGAPTWPEQMGLERVADMEMQLGPFAAPRALHLIAHSDGESAFKQDWVAQALENGRGREMPKWVPGRAPEVRIVAGLDLAMSLGPRADKTAIAVVAAYPGRGRRELIHLESFRGQIDVILSRVSHVLRNFCVGTIVVEAVQAQRFAADLLKRAHPGVRVLPFVTGGSGEKSIPWQANLFASELVAGRWTIPSGDGRKLHVEVRQLVMEILDWSPSDHCGDSLAALLFARSACDVGTGEFTRLNLLDR